MGQLLVLAQFLYWDCLCYFTDWLVRNGVYKTTYLIALSLPCIVVCRLHFFSISIFIAPTQLFELINGGIPDDIWVYLNDPELLPVIVAIIDLY